MIEERAELTVSERGDIISPSESSSVYKLEVQTHDPTAQIVVLNDRFNAVIKAAGSASANLPAGMYKVRVRRGASSIGFEDRVVVLDRDQSLSIQPPQLSSPAPIGGSRASEAHVAAREWLDGVVHVSLGSGSKIAVLARYSVSEHETKSLLHPFSGLELWRVDGEHLVDLKDVAPKVHLPEKNPPICVCGIAVDPGAYLLRYRLSTGRDFAQSLLASKGWQLSINIRRSPQDIDSKQGLFNRSGYVALLMRRLIDLYCAQHAPMRISKDGPIDEDQLADVARQGLADGSQLLSGNLYDLLLRDFDNPLVGIVGGLLLDLEREAVGAEFLPERTILFDNLVSKLRTMVGRGHPDVEALSFRCKNPRLAHRGAIVARPMFHRSWRIILETASKRHNLVPLDLWKRTTASGAMPPYLIWSVEASDKKARLKSLKRTAAALSTQRIQTTSSPDLERQAEAAIAARSLDALPAPAALSVASPAPANDSAEARSPDAAARSSQLPKRTARISREQIALEMGIPANALLHLIAFDKRTASSKLTVGTPAAQRSGLRTAHVETNKAVSASVKGRSSSSGAKKTGGRNTTRSTASAVKKTSGTGKRASRVKTEVKGADAGLPTQTRMETDAKRR
jgi:hypothetical protein